MAIGTMEELSQTLGDGCKVEPLDDQQARVLVNGGDIGFIDLETGEIETEIEVIGYDPGDEPDVVAARSRVDVVRQEWEEQGFSIESAGRADEYWYPSDSETRYPRVVFEAVHPVPALLLPQRYEPNGEIASVRR